MEIVEIAKIDDDIVSHFQRLLPQLDPGAAPVTRARLEAVAASPHTALLVAREVREGAARVLGTATLVCCPILFSLHSRIEDVVVDAAERGRGVGEALVRAALREARRRGAPHVDLTCRPAREAANRLYRRTGFQLRETNVYRYSFAADDPALEEVPGEEL